MTVKVAVDPYAYGPDASLPARLMRGAKAPVPAVRRTRKPKEIVMTMTPEEPDPNDPPPDDEEPDDE